MKIRPPVKWHGGKHYLAASIIKMFPEHSTYVEPFGGAASVLLNKPPCPVEVYNDLDGRITRLFRVIRDHGEELQRRLSLTPYSEVEFKNAKGEYETGDEIELARRDFVRWRMSLGGRGDSFSFTLHRVRRDMADVVSGYLSAIDDQLPLIAQRFRRVQIMERPAIEIIQKWDSPATLIYCDPPYVHETRDAGSREIYGKEMDGSEHAELSRVLRTCTSKIILSGYPSPLYSRLYSDWRTIEIEIPNHAAGGKRKAKEIEVLWRNW